MHCPKCSSDAYSKNGFKDNKQRYKCKECGCNFTQSHLHGYEAKWRELAVLLYVFGLSMNSIARLLGVSHQTSYRWIKKAAESLPAQPEVIEKVTEVEIDEMCLYLKKKAKKSGYGRFIAAELNDLSAGTQVLVMRLL